MKSLQTKIISLLLSCVLLTAFTVCMVGFQNTGSLLDQDSEQLILSTCADQVHQLDDYLQDIQQAVNALYHFSLDKLPDLHHLSKNEDILNAHIKNIREMSLSIAKNTPYAVSVYYRFAPELTTPTTGFFLNRTSMGEVFRDVELTDLSLYDPDDRDRVGWYYEPIQAGKPTWVNSYFNENVGKWICSYVIPVYQGDTTVGIVGMDIDTGLLRNAVKDVTIYESGYAFLLDSSGSIVYHPDWPGGLAKKDFTEEIRQMVGAMENTSSAQKIFPYEWNGLEKRIVTQRLTNGMTFVLTVPVREIDAPKRDLLLRTILLTAGILAVALPLMIRLVQRIVTPLRQLTVAAQKIARGDLDITIECHTKDEVKTLSDSFKQTAESLNQYLDYINRLAYTDTPTGVKNKTSYNETVSQLDASIASGNASFGVIVMDVNHLKQVNDDYGHERGDLLILDAAAVMKTVFGLSSLYRIGGDEFVAILTGSQLERGREISEEFGRALREFNLQSAQDSALKLQIASGLAVYRKDQDQSFSDVFRRADTRMYENKRKLKEQG